MKSIMYKALDRLSGCRGRLSRFVRRLGSNQNGLALVEFALTFPVVLVVGGYGIELANFAIINTRISQLTLELADNASRVGMDNGLASYKLDESRTNMLLDSIKMQGAGMKLTTNGRITLSSLEGQADGTQLLHWQRCIGLKSGAGYDSNYSAGTGSNGKTVTNIGGSSQPVVAPAGTGVMFVEVNYDYKPLFSGLFVDSKVISHTAFFLIRDNRDLSGWTNINNSPVYACTAHNA